MKQYLILASLFYGVLVFIPVKRVTTESMQIVHSQTVAETHVQNNDIQQKDNIASKHFQQDKKI